MLWNTGQRERVPCRSDRLTGFAVLRSYPTGGLVSGGRRLPWPRLASRRFDPAVSHGEVPCPWRVGKRQFVGGMRCSFLRSLTGLAASWVRFVREGSQSKQPFAPLVEACQCWCFSGQFGRTYSLMLHYTDPSFACQENIVRVECPAKTGGLPLFATEKMLAPPVATPAMFTRLLCERR